MRSVTLDGDVYDPSGTLSGGSAPTGSGILIKVQELMEIGGKLTAAKARLDQLEKEGLKGRQNRDEWKNLMRDLEMKEHEMKLMEQQLEGSNAARVSSTLPGSYPFGKIMLFSGWNTSRGVEANDCGAEAGCADCEGQTESSTRRVQKARERYGRVQK